MADTRLDAVFHALADPTRREILEILREGDRSTGNIAEEFTSSRPTISKHLGVLRDTGLVSRRKEGRNQIYRLRPDPLGDAHDYLEEYRRFWERGLLELKRRLEEEGT